MAWSCSGANAVRYPAFPSGNKASRRYIVIAASRPIDTKLKNAASKASSRWTGFSKTNKIMSRATAQISRNNSAAIRSEEHTSELQSRLHLVCRLLLEKKKKTNKHTNQ